MGHVVTEGGTLPSQTRPVTVVLKTQEVTKLVLGYLAYALERENVLIAHEHGIPRFDNRFQIRGLVGQSENRA